jgi:hypothetical protein
MRKSRAARQWRRPRSLADQVHCRHTWAAIAVGAGSAIVGAYSAHQQANAANKPRTAYTDQTTTQNPYLSDTLFPDIGSVLAYQRGMANQGAPQIDAHGNVYYTPLPTADSGTNSTPYYGGSGGAGGAGAGAGGAGGGAAPGRGGKGPATWVNAKGQTMTMGAGGKAVPYTGQGGAGGAGTGTGGTGGGGAGAPSTDFNDPRSISAAVARRGLDAGNTSTQTGARNLMSNIWGAAGTPGGSSGTGSTEQTGFEGYNPILNRLAGTLQGNVDTGNGQAQDLLLNFLGEDRRAGGASSSSGAGPGSGHGNDDGFGNGYGGAVTYINPNTGSPVSGSGSGGNYGGVPDTMVPSSFFGDQTRKLFDDPTNNADLQTVIDSMNADAQRGMYADLTQLDAASQGSGRLGGDTWKSVGNDARRTADQAMLSNSANVRLTDRAQRTAAKLQALGLVNQRDLGLLDSNTSRDNTATAAAASGAGTAAQLALAQRGQDLNAIQSLMQGEQFNIGQLGGVGQQLSSDRLGSLGMVPGLEGVGLSGLNAALGAAGNDVTMRGQDMGLREAQIGAGTARAGLAQQRGIFNATQQQGSVNDYLRTVLGIGGMGGTSTTQGTNVQPGLGVSPGGAAVQGALGGAATGLGIYNQYRGATSSGGVGGGTVPYGYYNDPRIWGG